MIIKNNFNTRRDNILGNDYQSIGSTRTNSLTNENPQIKESNSIIQDILNDDKEYDNEEEEKNKWDFFK